MGYLFVPNAFFFECLARASASCGQPEEQGLDVHMTEAARHHESVAKRHGTAAERHGKSDRAAAGRHSTEALGSFDKSSREFWQSSTEERSAKQ
jgi:hypothetical protein